MKDKNEISKSIKIPKDVETHKITEELKFRNEVAGTIISAFKNFILNDSTGGYYGGDER